MVIRRDPAVRGPGRASRRRVRLCTAIGLIGLLLVGDAAAAQPDCFRREDSLHLKYVVLQVANPPPFVEAAKDYAETSPYYPVSVFASGLQGVLRKGGVSASGLRFQRYYLQWVNRCVYLPGVTPAPADCANIKNVKGNGYPAMPRSTLQTELRPLFSTYEKANDCTLVQIERVLGAPIPRLSAEAGRAGLTLKLNSDQTAIGALARGVRFADRTGGRFLVDTCVLDASAAGPLVDGVMLDFEPQDRRSPQQTTAFLHAVRAVTAERRLKLGILTNPLPRAVNGIDGSNAHSLIALVDIFAPAVSTGASAGNAAVGAAPRERRTDPLSDLQGQIGVLGGLSALTPAERKKIVWQIGLYDTSVPEAAQIRRQVIANGFGGISIARTYVREGGACSLPQNQVIACLGLGACDARFGLNRDRP